MFKKTSLIKEVFRRLFKLLDPAPICYPLFGPLYSVIPITKLVQLMESKLLDKHIPFILPNDDNDDHPLSER